MNTEKTLMTFVREEKPDGSLGQPRGIIVAGFDEASNCVRMGWSFTNKSCGDSFNKKLGMKIAADRVHTDTDKQVPRLVLKQAQRFHENCRRFFKTDDIYIAGV